MSSIQGGFPGGDAYPVNETSNEIWRSPTINGYLLQVSDESSPNTRSNRNCLQYKKLPMSATGKAEFQLGADRQPEEYPDFSV
jgi:hypothetical protein